MSSAAVQHNTLQQYQQSPAGRERYPSNLSSSPPSARRPARTSSGNAPSPNTPQQMQYSSPTAPMGTPRGQSTPHSTHATPSEPMNSSTYQQFYPDGAPTGSGNLPIRSSSQQAPTSATSPAYDNRAYGSNSRGGYGSESERERASDNERRQRSQKSPSQGAGRAQHSRNAPSASRSATAVGQTRMDTSLPREHSAIINHIVVDDPQSDLARERARVQEARPHQPGMEPGATEQGGPESETKHRSRQEHLKQASNRKEVKFGDYILGQTLGEGEFGKVKMGWKKDSSVQVAIKLIRKESLQHNSSRLPKIYREITILRGLQHPNIVRLHEFVETERHMGIILEYASGGELFDYILNHRYLKDPAARRLFAQLVSGVGYLHKKGIVHRDLKLENLLLDRNRNIIITDFGFANTFDPADELGEEVEHRITDKEFVKRENLGEPNKKTGYRRGDLMQTSCGSPCYAAPELVVSDGLYTGRKVDVWSTGVILYAMLAGYLPFDDDPANPEGDNINLLYKYIVSTPLTFPEYVTPHARDLLRRILVPEPRRRADLFEVARHSWLSEYSHVVGFIGSSTKSDRDIASSAMGQEEEPALGRSASVREPGSRSPPAASGGPVQKSPQVSGGDAEFKQRDAKRRTVQVEYVAPRDPTARGEASPTAPQVPPITSGGRTKARGDGQGPVEVAPSPRRDPPVARKEVPGSQHGQPPTRPTRDQARAASESTPFSHQRTTSASRPATGGTLGSARLPSRGNSYSQPAVATPTTTNAQGHFSRPKSGSGYIISGPVQGDQGAESSRPGTSAYPSPYQQQQQGQYQDQQQQQQQQPPAKGHKRSSTLGSIGDRIMGRTNSRRESGQTQPARLEKKERSKYPPVSMRTAMPASNDEGQPRPSSDSRRPSFGFSRKNSEAPSESRRSSRRFSLLPSSFSMNNFMGGSKKDPAPSNDPYGTSADQDPQRAGRPDNRAMAFGRGTSASPAPSTTNGSLPTHADAPHSSGPMGPPSQPASASRYDKALPPQPHSSSGYRNTPPQSAAAAQRKQFRDDGYGGNALEQHPPPSRGGGVGGAAYQQHAASDPVERYYTPAESHDAYGSPAPNASQQQQRVQAQNNNPYPSTDTLEGQQGGLPQGRSRQNSAAQHIRPNQRKFANEFEHGHGGSSSATRRVMDFFRRRGREREN